jgi:tetratricopeptide (TPR) repeat protein
MVVSFRGSCIMVSLASAALPETFVGHYEGGRYLQAYEWTQAHGEVALRASTHTRLLVARLYIQLGAVRQGLRLQWQAIRADRHDPEARYWRAWLLLEKHGALAAWQHLGAMGDLGDAPVEQRADWLALNVRVLCALRDFERAEASLERAITLAPQRPWLWVEKAALLMARDACAEARESAERALALRPYYRPAVQTLAEVLTLSGKDHDALAFLEECDMRLECAAVTSTLATLQGDLGHHAQARESWRRVAYLFPLMEGEVARWLAGRFSDAAYACGDLPEAIRFARGVGTPMTNTLADRLSSAGEARRITLDVGLVRQNHKTCAPATLTAISRFWSMPAEHLAVAEEISYDGTPNHAERRWAEQSGWVVREFTVTWDTATTLLDRGVPFTVMTSYPGSAHLQAVAGYDARRRTLLLRDPNTRTLLEVDADSFLAEQAATGPRGMLLVPLAHRAKLEDLALPDAELYDRMHQLDLALVSHDRTRALALRDELRAAAPTHWLSHRAGRALAAYDGDQAELLATIERALVQHPDDVNLLLAKLANLRDLARAPDRLALLRELGDSSGAHPLLTLALAEELLADGRHQAAAEALLWRVMRRLPRDARSIAALASMRWNEDRRGEALELYRFAMCLEDKDEHHASAHFQAAQIVLGADAALRFLKERWQRLGKRSGGPGATLVNALGQLHRFSEAFALLGEASLLCPDDSDLGLAAAKLIANHAPPAQAEAELPRLRSRVRPAEGCRASAIFATRCGRTEEATRAWQELLAFEPLAMDAHEKLAELLVGTAGQPAALTHLEAACRRFPCHVPLFQLRLGYLEPFQNDEALRLLREMCNLHPDHAWIERELALRLVDKGMLDDAHAHAKKAITLEPWSPSSKYILAHVHTRSLRLPEAKALYREGLESDVNSGFAIGAWLAICETREEKREALACLWSAIETQAHAADAIQAYQQHAAESCDGNQVLAALEALRASRSYVWQTWSSSVYQLQTLAQVDRAAELASEATRRFPLLPGAWIDCAMAQQQRADVREERRCLEEALALNPSSQHVLLLLAGLHDRQGEPDAARQLIQRALVLPPFNGRAHGLLARNLRRRGQEQEAFEQALLAVRAAPDEAITWHLLIEMASTEPQCEQARALAVESGRANPGRATPWMALAYLLPDARAEDRLAAIDSALSADPRSIEAHDLRASILAGMRRYDEADKACRPAVYAGLSPLALRGRAAWVGAERGRLGPAMEAMEGLLREEPEYAWGHTQLAAWTTKTGKADHYIELLRDLVAACPSSIELLMRLGRAELEEGRRPAACSAVRQVLDLAPIHREAGLLLFDTAMDDYAYKEAREALAKLAHAEADPFVSARAVRLHAAVLERRQAIRHFNRICAASEENPWPLDTAARAMEKAGFLSEVRTMLDDAVERPGRPAHVAHRWAEYYSFRRFFGRTFSRLATLRKQGDVGIQATSRYLEMLGERRQVAVFLLFVVLHFSLLRSVTVLWGAVSYALVCFRWYGAVRRWMRDWRERADARPWMLLNLSMGLRAGGRDRDAAQAAERALSLPPDHTVASHQLWQALDAALEGDLSRANELLRASEGPSHTVYGYLRSATQAVILALGEKTPERDPFSEARHAYDKAVRDTAGLLRDPLLRRVHRRCLSAIRRAAGARALWWWIMRSIG